MGERAAEVIEGVFHEEYSRLLATLVRWLGDFDLAEEVAADALATAVERWPMDGVPTNPSAWLITTARRRAIDVLRRRRTHAAKLAVVKVETERAMAEPAGARAADADPFLDDRLRLFFTCCHPALALEGRIALTLRYLAGLSTAEVARAFLVSETTMAQRLTRAKRKIRQAQIAYRVPERDELPDRLPAVLRVIYVVFTEAYAASRGASLIRPDLADEAVRLARILANLLPSEREVRGLLALMLLVDARRRARTDDAGAIVLLADQDRSQWDRDKIVEGTRLVAEALGRGPPGPYGLQAAIAALHDEAASIETTDWPQIVALYTVLERIAPSPVVTLNRGVAMGMADGPAAGLRVLDELADGGALDRYHLLHAARGHLLAAVDDVDGAVRAYRSALAVVTNDAERTLLLGQLADVERRRPEKSVGGETA